MSNNLSNTLAYKQYVLDKIAESSSGGVSSWNDLTDKPFYEENTGATIEWDGNTEGRDNCWFSDTYFDGGGYYLYKLSNDVPSKEELIGGVLTAVDGSEQFSMELTDDTIETYDGCHGFAPILVVVTDTECFATDTAFNPPSTGIYACLQGELHLTSLTYGSTTIKTLDEKFIPDTIARVEDLTAPKTELILLSSTADSTKQFKITIDDEGVLTATEIVESEA